MEKSNSTFGKGNMYFDVVQFIHNQLFNIFIDSYCLLYSIFCVSALFSKFSIVRVLCSFNFISNTGKIWEWKTFYFCGSELNGRGVRCGALLEHVTATSLTVQRSGNYIFK